MTAVMAERFVEADDGVKLWVRDVGDIDAPAVVCCHGGPGVADYLEPIEELLAPEFRVIRWDQRGSGRSDPNGPFSIERFVRDLDVVRRDCGLNKFILFGHSWGANLAVLYAQSHSQAVEAIVYVSGIGLEWWPKYSQMHKVRLVERLEPADRARLEVLSALDRDASDDHEYRLLHVQSEQHDVADSSMAKLTAASESKYNQSRSANALLNAECKQLPLADQVTRCGSVRCPVLVVHGASDPRPVEALGSMLGALPSVEFHLIEAAGHTIWLDQRDRLASLVTDFLNRKA